MKKVSVTEAKDEAVVRLLRLIRDGIVRPARAAAPRSLFAHPPPGPKEGAAAVAALLAERREGR